MIILEHIGKSVPGLEILKDISISFDQGLTFIVGDSGAGKSSLMNIISTVDAPTGGSIRYELENVTFTYSAASKDEEISRFRGRHLGIIFQDFNLVGDMDADQNLRLGGALAGISVQAGKVRHCLSSVNLPEEAGKPMHVMSGGERQRVAIARALLKEADIILADEPTGNLDEKNTTDIFNELKAIARHKIVIVISHNLEMARQYADRIIRMRDGRIVEDAINQAQGFDEKKPLGKKSSKKKAQKEAAIADDSAVLQKETGSRGIPFALVKAFAFNNVKKFRAKFVSMVAVMSIALAGAGLLFSMNHLMSNEADNLSFTYFDADLVLLRKGVAPEDQVRNMVCGSFWIPILPEEAEDVKQAVGFAEVVPVDITGYGIVGKGPGQKLSVKAIRLNSFFEKRIMSDQIEGRFPENGNEIIIGEDISRQFFEGKGIGESLQIGDYGRNIFTFTICGINHSKNVDGIYYCYAFYETLLEGHFPSDNYGTLSLAEDAQDPENGLLGVSGGNLTDEFQKEELVAGKLPETAGELTVSINIFIELYRAIEGSFPAYSLSEIKEGKPEALAMLNTVFEHGYYIGLNDAYTCKVVGLHERDNHEIFVDGAWMKSAMVKQATGLECYFGDMDKTRKADFSGIEKRYDVRSLYLERFANAVDAHSLWKTMFLIGALLSLVTVFALANSYARVTLSERVYEIGIIKSLGGQKKDIARLLRADQFLLGGISGLLGAGLYLLALLILKLLGKGVMTSSLLTSGTALCIFLCGLLGCLLLSGGKISKAARTRPVEDLRKH